MANDLLLLFNPRLTLPKGLGRGSFKSFHLIFFNIVLYCIILSFKAEKHFTAVGVRYALSIKLQKTKYFIK